MSKDCFNCDGEGEHECGYCEDGVILHSISKPGVPCPYCGPEFNSTKPGMVMCAMCEGTGDLDMVSSEDYIAEMNRLQKEMEDDPWLREPLTDDEERIFEEAEKDE